MPCIPDRSNTLLMMAKKTDSDNFLRPPFHFPLRLYRLAGYNEISKDECYERNPQSSQKMYLFRWTKTSRVLLVYLVRKWRNISPRSVFRASKFLSYCFHEYKTGKKHKEDDIAVFNSHLTSSNLVFVRQFTCQNKGNLFLFSILAVHFQFALAQKKYRPRSLARSCFDHKRLVISTKPLEKKVKMTREKLKFKVRKFPR